MAGVGIPRAFGVGGPLRDPGVFGLVDGDVAVDESGFERLGEDRNGVGGDLDGAVDVLPFTAA